MGEEIKWVQTPTSLNVSRIGYNAERQWMYVDFIRSGIYKYTGVPEEVWNEALNAPSIGKFTHEHLKGKYMASKA